MPSLGILSAHEKNRSLLAPIYFHTYLPISVPCRDRGLQAVLDGLYPLRDVVDKRIAPTVAALLRESQAGSHPCIITLSSYWQAWQRTLLTHCASSGKERERGLYDLALIISDKYKYSTKPHKGQYTFSLLLVWEHRGLQSNTHQLNMKESRSSSCR